jgi:site-specific DNA-cytosine methylase
MQAAVVASAIIAEVRFVNEMNPFLWQAGGYGSRAVAAPRLIMSDWCNGIGGSSNGAQHAGGVIVRAIERQAPLRKLFTKSFGVIPGCDVRTNVEDAGPLAPARSIDITISFECSAFSQAGAQASLSDQETVATIDQVFMRLQLEQPDGALLENVRGLVTMADGEVLRWVLEGVRGAGYVTAHRVDGPPSLGKCFNRPRLHLMALRNDLVQQSWWARMDPRTWFTPCVGTRFSVVSHYLESPYASQELLESRGARFVSTDDIRFLDGDAHSSPPEVAQIDRPYIRCHWSKVPVHDGLSPAETYVIALHGPVVPRFGEHNCHRVYSARGLAPIMVRRGPFRTAVFMIPGSSPGAKHKRAAVFRTLTHDECCRILDSTRTLAEMHTPKACIERPLGFHPETRADLISPDFDAVVARHTQWLLERDSAILCGEIPRRPHLSLAIFYGLENVHVHIVGNTLVMHLELFLNQHVWGQVWRSVPGKAPERVKPVPVHTVSLAASLARGDLSGTTGELLAHILPLRGCYGGSMISPMLVILANNSDRFIGDERAVKDTDNEIEANCLERFSGADPLIPCC